MIYDTQTEEEEYTTNIGDYKIIEINPSILEKLLTSGISIKQIGRPILSRHRSGSLADEMAIAILESIEGAYPLKYLSYGAQLDAAIENIRRKENLPDFYMADLNQTRIDGWKYSALVFYKIIEKSKWPNVQNILKNIKQTNDDR